MATPPHLKLALSVTDAADLFSLSEASIRRAITDKTIARVPHTERVLIARIELERWAASSSTEAMKVWEASYGRPVQMSVAS